MAHRPETSAIARRDLPHAPGRPSSPLAHTGLGLLAVWFLALGVLPGCDPWVVGDGVFKEEVRTVAAFTAVSVQDGIEVRVTAGSAQRSLSVSGDENVLQHVKTTVKTEAGTRTLVVEADVPHLEATLPLLVTVGAPEMTAVTAIGASRVMVSGAAADQFVVMAGSGAAVSLAGAGGERLVVSLWGGEGGGASLDARSYIVDQAAANLSGGSLAQLHVDELVTGSVVEGSTLQNVGEGSCEVEAGEDASVVCMN